MFRKVIKKLNDFRFTAILMTIISGVAAVYSLGSFVIYHMAGDLDEQSKGLIRNVGFSSTPKGPYWGMILFLVSFTALFISIFLVYSLIPYIKNKEKLYPRKGLLLAGFVGAFFELFLFVLMIVLLATNPPHANHTTDVIWKVFLIISLPFGLASTIGTGLYLIPYLKCDFYMPAVKQ